LLSITLDFARMNHQPTATEPVEYEGMSQEMRDCWRRLPNKTFFFVLLAAWVALFQLLGSSTFGYSDTPSLFRWMYEAYIAETVVADDSHGLLIPFVVLGLMWWKRQELLSQPLYTWWPGLLLVTLGLLLHLAGYVMQQGRVSIVGLFVGLYGLTGLAWGPGWLKRSFFPFFLFGFCVPLGSLTEPITFPLRLLVSKLVAIFGQNVLAIDVVNVGTRLIKMPWQYEYEVAAACSGIRSLVAIVAIAIVYAFMVFNKNWQRAVLIASAFPLAVIGNTVRMMLIVIAAELRGRDAGIAVHDSTFWSMIPYVPAIIGLMLIGRWLEGPIPPRVNPARGTGNR
jgi:exosortase